MKKSSERGGYVVDHIEKNPNIPGHHTVHMRFDPDARSFEGGRVVIPEDKLHPDLSRVYEEGVGWIVAILEQRDESQD